MQLRLAAALLLAALSLGCPFLDELNNSSAEMDKYSQTGRKMAEEKKAAEAAKAEGKTTSGLASAKGKAGNAAASAGEAASKWWSNATSLNTDERDPDLVRCQLPGRVEFMRKHDCLMRSGLALK
jgi:hypothetical protein